MLIHRKLWLKQEFSRISPGVQLLGGKQVKRFNQSQALIPIHCGWLNIREMSQENRRRFKIGKKKEKVGALWQRRKRHVFSWGTCEFHSLAGSAGFPISILLLSGPAGSAGGSSHRVWPLAGSGVTMAVLSQGAEDPCLHSTKRRSVEVKNHTPFPPQFRNTEGVTLPCTNSSSVASPLCESCCSESRDPPEISSGQRTVLGATPSKTEIEFLEKE